MGQQCSGGEGTAKTSAFEDWEAITSKPDEDASPTSIEIYPEAVHGNPITEFGDGVVDDCDKIHKAVRGWGTNEKALIETLGGVTQSRRMEIYVKFDDIHGKNLQEVMKSECGSRDMGLALQLLALPPDEAEAMMLKLGKQKRYIYPILCGRSNEEIRLLRRAFYKRYGRDLSVQMKMKLGKSIYERFLMHCLQGFETPYEERYHTPELAAEDARAFHKAGEGKWGTDEEALFEIICRSPPSHLINVDKCYSKLYGGDTHLLEAVDREMGGHVGRATAYAVGMKLQPYRTVARQIKLACQGFGTDELALTMLVIRYQKILAKVDEAHMELYSKSMADRIKAETSGQYRVLLLQVVKAATVV